MEVKFNKRWLTGDMEVAGVDGVVDDAVLVKLVVAHLHLDLEKLVLPVCVLVCTTEDYSVIREGTGTCMLHA